MNTTEADRTTVADSPPAPPPFAGAAGALLAGTAVAAGAFGAHALRDAVPAEDLEIWHTAVRYQAWHGLALFALPAVARPARLAFPTTTAACWTAGTVVFSGSLYVLVLSGVRWLGAVTPLGGLLMLAGWAAALARRR